MTEEKTNPGNHVMSIGLGVLFVFIVGMGFGVLRDPGEMPTPGLIAAGVILGLTIFIASVVGAYYAGKGKR